MSHLYVRLCNKYINQQNRADAVQEGLGSTKNREGGHKQSRRAAHSAEFDYIFAYLKMSDKIYKVIL